MAVSAFRSTSKRGHLGNKTSTSASSSKQSNLEDLNKKIPYRRSRSVSAISRSSVDDFLNKRDNPLFFSTSSSPPDVIESENLVSNVKIDKITCRVDELPSKLVGNSVSDERRGRSVSRTPTCGNQLMGTRNGIGRSLSRVDMGRRRRSVSRAPHENSESENEQKYSSSSSLRNTNKGNSNYNVKKTVNVITSDSEPLSQTRTLQTWSSQHPFSDPSDGFTSCVQTANWEDGISTSSFSEVEEKTIKAVSEQMKRNHPVDDARTGGIYETVRSEVRRAISEIQNDLENVIQRKNLSTIATTNVADIPPELVNPDAIELVSEIRREYASKLTQSQERARKLRADLAVEEHRGQELNRILKEILPEPKNFQTPKTRPRRKNSIERWKMSKRLTEEAMNYFDECVSISTFDSSDLSSQEDPPQSLAAIDPLVGDGIFIPSASSSTSAKYGISSYLNDNKESDNQGQSMLSHTSSDLGTNSNGKQPFKDQDNLTCIDTTRNLGFHFSFAHEPTETVGIQHDIRNYIKIFEKKNLKDGKDHKVMRSNYYDGDKYELQIQAERLLFDRVILKNRIGSGGILLCGTRGMV